MKKVVVTGASKGIGRALVEKFASQGYEIVFCSRNKAELKSCADEIRNKYPQAKLHYTTCDVSQRDDLQRFFHFVEDNLGNIDILINNAGVFLPGQLHNEEEGVLEHQMETNVYSAYHLSRLFLPGMMNARSGHIFNMCSTASITAYVNGGSYCISKYALHGMTKVLREELKPYGIKVTAILPGATLTHSWEGTELPEERFMRAADVAEAVFSAANLSPSAVIEEILMRPLKGDI